MKMLKNEQEEGKTTVVGAPTGQKIRSKERKAKEAKGKNENDLLNI